MMKKIDLSTDSKQREEFFRKLYQEAFPAIAKYIADRGGTLDEASDIFQDAVIAYYEKITSTSFTLEKGEKAYLFGISKNLWYRRSTENSRKTALNSLDTTLLETGENILNAESILQFLSTAGKKCMEVLQSFYYHKESMKEIAQSFGFTSERSATVQKYKCLEKVRNTIKEKSMRYEDFVN